MISGTAGAYIPHFEEAVAAYCGKKHGIAASSCSTALILAIASLQLQKGDEVIVSALTNIATALAVVHNGAIPVPVDSEIDTWNIDPARIEEKLTSRTRAILPVHIYGHPCDMDPIMDIARRHNLYVIEDAAESQGATYKGVMTGGMGDIGCFSFYANKIITTGEGGMLTTDDDQLADMMRLLRNLSFGKKSRFMHEYAGYNYRMTNIEAAIGLAQMKRIDYFIDRKRYIADYYNRALKGLRGLRLPVEKNYAINVYWMYCIVVEDEFGLTRDQLMQTLAEKGIETRQMFTPMNVQPVFHKMGLFTGRDVACPVAEDIGRKGLYLPSGTRLSDDQLDYICNAVITAGKKGHG
jgi:perosamine synthetase